MSRKNYQALAAAILESKTESSTALGSFTVLQRTAGRIADVLAADNPRFDRSRFLTACGFGKGTRC